MHAPGGNVRKADAKGREERITFCEQKVARKL
jgi:hypothetical protein